MERTGSFPSRRKIGENAIGWAEREVQQWLSIVLTQSEKKIQHEVD
jgi:predicted DNA-binding transcriptional regulator AlpA